MDRLAIAVFRLLDKLTNGALKALLISLAYQSISDIAPNAPTDIAG